MIKKFEQYKNSLNEKLSDLQKQYRAYFRFMLDCYDVKSPAKLSEEKKKEFFDNVNKYWTKGKGPTKDLDKIKIDICGEDKKIKKLKKINELESAGTFGSPGIKPIGYDVNTKFYFTDPVGTLNPNKQYQVLQFIEDGKVKIKDLYRDDISIFSTKELNNLLSSGEIKIIE